MAQRTEQLVANGVTFHVGQFPPRRALILSGKLVKAFGPAFSNLVFSVDFRKNDVDLDRLASVAQTLFAHASPEQAMALVDELLVCVTAQGAHGSGPAAGVVDAVFLGDLFGLCRLVGLVLQVNYADFFGDAREWFQSLRATFPSLGSALKSSKHGPFGDSLKAVSPV